jgi:hypothetical protein
MAATASPLVVKRLNYELTENFEVYLNCSVQMFKLTKAKGMLFDGFFPQGTGVKLNVQKSKEAIAKGFKFYYVASRNKEGYVPKSAFHDFVYAQLNDTPYTGVTYGGDKWLTDGKGNPIAFPEDDTGKHPCPRCGSPVNDHKLFETKHLSSMLDELIRYLSTSAKQGAFDHSGFMLAALHTKGNKYVVAYSGTLGTQDLKEFDYCVSCLVEKPVVAKPLTGSKYYFGIREQREYSNKAGSWSCAAPRAIQCAWRFLKDYPVDMSEKWYGERKGIAQHMDTVKSCDECRRYLPYMMCGTAFMRL